jgi:glycosyltransferase involved in cell wall biosynthesis
VDELAVRAERLCSTDFKRAIILDPGLGPIPGHWATYARKLEAAFSELGLGVVLCGHCRQDADILDGLKVEPLFALTPYEPYGKDPHDRPTAIASFQLQKAQFAADLEKLEDFGVGPQDLVVFLTIYPQILGGLVEWIGRKPHRRDLRAALLLQFSEEVNVYDKVRGAHGDVYYVDYYRQTLPASEGRDAFPNWRYFAASPGLGDLFSTLIGKDVRPLPMPGSAVRPAALSRRPGSKEVRVAILGHTSIEKGALLLADIIFPTLAQFAHVRFNFHLSTNPDTRALDVQFAQGTERLAIKRGHISDSDMQAIVDDSDIVLLPYRPLKYRLMPSAIFIQAGCSGKVVVLPASSHMHRELLLRGGGYTLFHEHSAAAIRDALWAAIGDVERLSAAAAAAAPLHREVNNPHAYVKRIVEAFA